MAQNLGDRGAIRALEIYHETLSDRLDANSILSPPDGQAADIHRIVGGAHAFSRNASPLQQLDVYIRAAETFITMRIVGRGGVNDDEDEDERVEYVRRFGAWLIEFKDILQRHGNDVPVMQRYVRLVNEHLDAGQTVEEAGSEEPGFEVFQRVIREMGEGEPLFDDGELESPERQGGGEEDDSDEVVWLNNYYGELLEVKDLFRDAKRVFGRFADWAVGTIQMEMMYSYI